jgi:hypothetical protein
MHARISLCRASPDQGNDPPNYRPSEEQVEQKDTRGITFIAPNNRRKEIQQNHEGQGKHGAPSKSGAAATRLPPLFFMYAQGG